MNSGCLIAIASSTGGPQALMKLIPKLPVNLGVPVVIVQHMPSNFTRSMAHRLDSISQVTVKEAEEGEVLQNGWVYVAPGDTHLEIVEDKKGVLCAHLSDAPAIKGLRPCADIMFASLLKLSIKDMICVVLTGMGSDGLLGIKGLRGHKNIYVITQSEESCIVYGMPRVVEQAGLANETLPIDKISDAIIRKLGG